MKIFITGSGGMVGRNLIENRQMREHELLSPSSQELDLLDFAAVKSYIEKSAPDMVVHCAGKVGGIQANMADMYGFFADNALMGINLVRAAKECGVRKFLNLSSSCTYPRNYKNPLKEEYMMKAELEPTNEGYALAKLSVLKMCAYLNAQHPEFEYKTMIPCNLYGRWDKFGAHNSHMLPSVIRKITDAMKSGRTEVEIWGDGESRREFMYAGDLADCIAKAVDDFGSVPPLMNVGLGHDHTINEYYRAVGEVAGYKGGFTHDLEKPVGMNRKLLDVSIQQKWGWRPSTGLHEGIAKTLEFYKSQYHD